MDVLFQPGEYLAEDALLGVVEFKEA